MILHQNEAATHERILGLPLVEDQLLVDLAEQVVVVALVELLLRLLADQREGFLQQAVDPSSQLR